ncbi:uncharacterized protein LOC119277204 isoform X1 [Triticum dicoccoides]|uniref:uncharacterized protein LOC119277204 isoform X1 n=1 Tax=Triticum dicoccoides TaxID=85692 RepID=UPI00188E8326|nr:uncharacterized protein LOC119277204 isoform X1 [Triticum dicoccoides]XP_037414346.1 uncharacterized protein LOC119277204 isoform X1 [Triticum dicoccoides]XP_037414347.1 uncharacterized protein LOC119277204 isoform X1 [Triticum dicoccoides]XP_037414348.1 uncharacterized protein LOC119277204 isoform X1 [Triticum dicoccoides]XP_037414349.1 uncharacterized protein LOC119277204 isoform X1 [Triticum dicoccoides]XP_037414350.1 uncharacterized protein LOC119277204 isoform X1 [Triticum dicoccoides]
MLSLPLSSCNNNINNNVWLFGSTCCVQQKLTSNTAILRWFNEEQEEIVVELGLKHVRVLMDATRSRPRLAPNVWAYATEVDEAKLMQDDSEAAAGAEAHSRSASRRPMRCSPVVLSSSGKAQPATQAPLLRSLQSRRGMGATTLGRRGRGGRRCTPTPWTRRASSLPSITTSAAAAMASSWQGRPQGRLPLRPLPHHQIQALSLCISVKICWQQNNLSCLACKVVIATMCMTPYDSQQQDDLRQPRVSGCSKFSSSRND